LWLGGALAILSFLVPGGAQAEEPSPGSSAGSPLFGFNDDWQDARGEFEFARDAGAEVIRFPIGWHKVQPHSPLLWDWSLYDAIFEEARENGLGIVFAPQTSPCWARGEPLGDCDNPGIGYPPNDEHLGSYEAFVRAAVQRYPDIVAIEAWNEPNLAPFWNPSPSPEAYVALLEATYRAVKEVRPDMPVLFGGLASIASTSTAGRRIAYAEFLRRAYELGAGDHFDAMSLHTYVWSQQSKLGGKSTAAGVCTKRRMRELRRLRRLHSARKLRGGGKRRLRKLQGKCERRARRTMTLRRAGQVRAERIVERAEGIVAEVQQIMADNGQASKDVWITEVGLTTRGRWAVSPKMQGELLPRLYDALSTNPKVRSVIFHRMFDGSGEGSGAAYGLVHSDHETLKPAYCAIANWRGRKCR
jgi:hypothetical protein